ncbi:uncharacterized protein LOC134524101 isoform X2 [Chroicocephalus ridibundus]|uniref:uncharacterized protein LOC134524101 isoform X2 n=1 Tax=Chroicocephalus ridibundus TaxID=1192867 RepID=UPI002FDD1B33
MGHCSYLHCNSVWGSQLCAEAWWCFLPHEHRAITALKSLSTGTWAAQSNSATRMLEWIGLRIPHVQSPAFDTGQRLTLQWKIQFTHCQGQFFTERLGEITSPDYPTPYPALSSCSCSIQVEDGSLITLEFTEAFNVETLPGVLCPSDVLKSCFLED